MKPTNKARVLAGLYNACTFVAPIARFTGQFTPDDMTDEEAQKIIDDRGKDLYFDYVKGRCIKTDLNNIDMRLYNRDNGPEAGENVLLKLGITVANL